MSRPTDGPAWERAQDLSRKAKVQLERGAGGSLSLEFYAGDWDRGRATWSEPAERARDGGLDVYSWGEVVMTDDDLGRYPRSTPQVSARVRLSALDWSADVPVAYGLEVEVHEAPGERYALEGSGTAPAYLHGELPPERWSSLVMQDTEGLQRLATWTRDARCYGEGVEVLIDPDYRCEHEDWMEPRPNEGTGIEPVDLHFYQLTSTRLLMIDSAMSPTEVLFTVDDAGRISVEAARTYDFVPLAGRPQNPVWSNPSGRLIVSTGHWEQAGEVHLEYQIVCGPPEDPFVLRGAGSALRQD